jgi:hypothetical protein
MFARRLSREIVALLLLKAAALAVLFFLFFGPAQRTHVDASRMGQQILSEQSRP